MPTPPPQPPAPALGAARDRLVHPRDFASLEAVRLWCIAHGKTRVVERAMCAAWKRARGALAYATMIEALPLDTPRKGRPRVRDCDRLPPAFYCPDTPPRYWDIDDEDDAVDSVAETPRREEPDSGVNVVGEVLLHST